MVGKWLFAGMFCLLSSSMCSAAQESFGGFDPQNPDSFFQVDEPEPGTVKSVKKGPKYSWLSKVAIQWGIALAMYYESASAKLAQWKQAICALFARPVQAAPGTKKPVLKKPGVGQPCPGRPAGVLNP